MTFDEWWKSDDCIRTVWQIENVARKAWETALKEKTEPVAEVPCSDRVMKPCPFCGSDCVNDTTEPKPDKLDSYYWVCPDCVSCGPIGSSVAEATNRWNERAS